MPWRRAATEGRHGREQELSAQSAEERLRQDALRADRRLKQAEAVAAICHRSVPLLHVVLAAWHEASLAEKHAHERGRWTLRVDRCLQQADACLLAEIGRAHV